MDPPQRNQPSSPRPDNPRMGRFAGLLRQRQTSHTRRTEQTQLAIRPPGLRAELASRHDADDVDGRARLVREEHGEMSDVFSSAPPASVQYFQLAHNIINHATAPRGRRDSSPTGQQRTRPGERQRGTLWPRCPRCGRGVGALVALGLGVALAGLLLFSFALRSHQRHPLGAHEAAEDVNWSASAQESQTQAITAGIQSLADASDAILALSSDFALLIAEYTEDYYQAVPPPPADHSGALGPALPLLPRPPLVEPGPLHAFLAALDAHAPALHASPRLLLAAQESRAELATYTPRDAADAWHVEARARALAAAADGHVARWRSAVEGTRPAWRATLLLCGAPAGGPAAGDSALHLSRGEEGATSCAPEPDPEARRRDTVAHGFVLCRRLARRGRRAWESGAAAADAGVDSEVRALFADTARRASAAATRLLAEEERSARRGAVGGWWKWP